MNKPEGQQRKSLRNRPLVAGGLLALFLFVLAMAQFKTLHRFCHAEADQQDHQCAVTTLAAGQVDAPTGAALIISATALLVGEVCVPTSSLPAVDHLLLPSRGPPALLS